MRLTNKRNDLIHNPLTEPVFYQFWSDSNINPPPPESALMITEVLGDPMITESGLYMITE